MNRRNVKQSQQLDHFHLHYLSDLWGSAGVSNCSKILQIDADSEKQYTYAEVIMRIQQLAAGLRNIGLRQGNVLCVLMYNDIDYPIIMYATNMLGAVLQTMSPLYKDGKLQAKCYTLSRQGVSSLQTVG